MPRRSFNRSRRTRRRPRVSASISGSDRTELIPGKLLQPISLLAGSTLAIPLAPNSLGTRLTALATVFQEHRFLNVTIMLHPGFSAPGVRTSYAVGYFKVPPLTPPANLAQVYTATSSRYSDTGDTLPVRLALNRPMLLNNVRPWFTNQVASGSETLDSIQGVLYVSGTSTSTLDAMLEISYICAMRGPTSPQVS